MKIEQVTLQLYTLRDYRVMTNNQPTFGEIGSGNLGWRKIIAASESGCQWFIVEQDTCPGDPFDPVAESFRYISAHLCS